MEIKFFDNEISIRFLNREETVKTKELAGRSFVYGLICNNEIVYIGATISIYNRLLQHRAKIYYTDYKFFDRLFLIEFPDRNSAFRNEKNYIFDLKPKFNNKHKNAIEGTYNYQKN